MERILLYEDFTRLFNRWYEGGLRKEDDHAREFISRQEHPEKFSIDKDGKVNAKCDVEITQDDLIDNKLPCQFGHVSGYFNILYADIDSLKGVPETVGENFTLWDCANLTSLEYSPKKVRTNYVLFNVGIENMSGCTPEIGGSLSIENCKNIKSLIGSPKKINTDFNIFDCENLVSIEGIPLLIGGNFSIKNDKKAKKVFHSYDLPKGCIIKRRKIFRN